MAAADPTPLRQTSGTLTLIETRSRPMVRGGKSYLEKVAVLRCACGAEFVLILSRWRSQPPQRCQKCAIKKAKKFGWHGFRARKKEAPIPLDNT